MAGGACVLGGGACLPGCACWRGICAGGMHAGEMSIEVGGTHPTGFAPSLARFLLKTA